MDALIVTWEWDFGEGDTAIGETVIHAYDDDGVYTASLVVTDDDGIVGEDSLVVAVANAGPTVMEIVAPTAPVSKASTVVVSSSFTDSGRLDTHSAEWDWGDGTTGPER